MHRVMCINQHHYDADQYTVCPYCGVSGRINANAMDGDDLGATTWLGADGQFHDAAGGIQNTTVLDDINATTVLTPGGGYGQQALEKRCCNCFRCTGI